MATPAADRGKVEKFSVYLTFDLIAFIWSLKLYIVHDPNPHLHQLRQKLLKLVLLLFNFVLNRVPPPPPPPPPPTTTPPPPSCRGTLGAETRSEV